MLLLIGVLLLLLVLIVLLKLHPFIALSLAALVLGIVKGLAPLDVAKSIQKGMGNTLGGVVLVLGLGIILGRLLTESGAAQRLSTTLTRVFGTKRIKYALLLTSFTVGLAMFYNAGFIVMLPLVFGIAAQTQLPLPYLALIMAAAMSVTHGFLPPHPGPVAIAVLFKADLGRTLLYGLLVAVPTLCLAGVWFPERIRNMQHGETPALLEESKALPDAQLPAFWKSLLAALLPVLLTGLVALADIAWPLTPDVPIAEWRKWLQFIGEPGISMLAAVLFALLFLGVLEGKKMSWAALHTESALAGIAGILLIIAAGGGFRQVLEDTGVSNSFAALFRQSSLPPLLLGWLVAAFVRVVIGSATVAGMTAGGLVAPLLIQSGANPELMVLSIGAGSLMFSHVNDSGFWMFKASFGLSIRQTILSWSLMETIVSVAGLLGVLLLNFLLRF